MDRVRDGEFPIRLGLQLDQVVLTMVHGTRDIALLPAGVIHVGQGLEFLAHGIFGPAFFG
jgi:hypothetical protein